jgi:hypothetical protein
MSPGDLVEIGTHVWFCLDDKCVADVTDIRALCMANSNGELVAPGRAVVVHEHKFIPGLWLVESPGDAKLWVVDDGLCNVSAVDQLADLAT